MSIDNIKVTRGYEMILEGLGYDWLQDPHMARTPERAAKAMIFEICSSLTEDPPDLTTFPLEGDGGMVISRHIPVKSLCAHHLLPFTGEATVGYIPDGKLVGLSKLSRVVRYFSRRPQVQERITADVADYIEKGLRPIGVAVCIISRHSCMELRGVEHPSDVVTSAPRGEFNSPEVRAEFLSLAGANGR